MHAEEPSVAALITNPPLDLSPAGLQDGLAPPWLALCLPLLDLTVTLGTLARLTLAQFASIRLHLHWLGYHKAVGGVNALKRDNNILNIFFYFYQHCFSVWV